MMKATIMCVAIEAIRAHPLVSKKLVGGVAAWLNTESLQPPQGAKVPPRDHLVPPQENIRSHFNITLPIGYFLAGVKTSTKH